jgi:hypothetical protein
MVVPSNMDGIGYDIVIEHDPNHFDIFTTFDSKAHIAGSRACKCDHFHVEMWVLTGDICARYVS